MNKLLRLLSQLFRLQAREASALAARSLEVGTPIDLAPWNKVMAGALAPFFLEAYEEGMRTSRAMKEDLVQTAATLDRIFSPGLSSLSGSTNRRTVPTAQAFSRVTSKALSSRARRRIVTQSVRDAVDAATFAFCAETNSKMTDSVNETVEKIRVLIREGIDKRRALSTMTKEVRKLVADPVRAARIVNTETRRMRFAGQTRAASLIGTSRNKRWVANPNCCKSCAALNGKVVPLAAAFTVLPSAGIYSIVNHPPLHPNCYCSMDDIP